MAPSPRPSVPLTSEQQQKAAENISFALNWIKPFQRRFPYLQEELESLTGLVLTQAVRDWDGRGNFIAYFLSTLRKRQQDLIRKELKCGVRGVKPRQILRRNSFESINEVGFPQVVDSKLSKQFQLLDEMDYVEWVLKKLPDLHRRVCMLYFLYDLQPTEIGQVVGKSRSRVSHIVKDCQPIIRKYLCMSQPQECFCEV